MSATSPWKVLFTARNAIALLAVAILLIGVTGAQRAHADPPNPSFAVWVHEDYIEGWNWPAGVSVTLTVDDPGTGAAPDYTEAQVVSPAPWDPGNLSARFSLQGVFDVQTGHVVTLTDGVTPRTHVVTTLTVTSVDPFTDTVSGTADPGTSIYTWTCDPAGCVSRSETVDAAGVWAANFGVPGDEPGEQDTFDIRPGSNGEVAGPSDAEGNHTRLRWRVPNPSFTVWRNNNEVHGYDWPEGALITLVIEDPTTPESPDYTVTQVAAPTDWDPSGRSVQFVLRGHFQLRSGQMVTLTSGPYVRVHTITALTVTGADAAPDTVSGTAAPGSDVYVDFKWDSNARRHEVAATDGSWMANFAQPGDEPGEEPTFDISPGLELHITQRDDDGDGTAYYWRVPNPRFGVWPLNDSVAGWEWRVGATINLAIDADGDAGNGVLYAASQTVDAWGNFNFGLSGVFDVQPGQWITVGDGVTTRTHTATSLVVTAADDELERVTGTAAASAQVDVYIWSWNAPSRQVTADASGNWVADFAGAFDLAPGLNGAAQQIDADGDFTQADWHVPHPRFGVWPASDNVSGWEWPAGATISLTIDDDDDLDNGVLYTASTNVDAWTNFNFNLSGTFDVQPGQRVTVGDGATTKRHTITDVTVAAVDADANTVSGTAQPGSVVEVQLWGAGAIQTMANASGAWLADWTGRYDMLPGTNGAAQQYDADSDVTQVDWRVPNPRFGVWPLNDSVAGWEWRAGATVSLAIDDDGNAGNGVLYAASQTADTWGNFNLDLNGFDLQSGHQVTVTDGASTKTHTITSLAVTGIDPDADIVSGTAASASRVDVWSCNEEGCFNRHEVVEGGEFVGVVEAGQVADQFIPSILWGYNDALVDYAYDPALAMSLLADAGYTDGFTINLWLRDIPRIYLPDAIGVAEAIRDYLGVVGITANVQVLDPGEMIDRVWNGEADLFLLGWAADYGHPDNFYYHHFCTEADALGLQYEDFCDQIMAARAETDPLALVSLYEGISQQVHDGIPVVPLAYVRTPLLFRHDVTGFVPSWEWTGTGSFSNVSYGGSDFTYASSAGVPGLDPALHIDSGTYLVTSQVMETLVKTDAGSATPLPGLAESWSVSPDGLTWTFTLRSGLTFHDGTALDAAAVVYNLERWWDPAHPYHDPNFEYFRFVFNAHRGDPESLIVALGAIGADQVQITLREPFSPMPSALAMPAFAIASPAAIQSGNLNTHPVGTGPFVFVDWTPDGTIHLTASSDYWGGAPSLANLAFQVLSDDANRFAALQANSVQGIEIRDWSYVHMAEGDANLQVVWRPEMNVAYLGINQGHSPLDRLLVRQAIAHAIDKEAIIAEYYNTVVYGIGAWTADFAHPGDEGDEQTTWDMQPGDGGDVAQWDDDGDSTQISWHVPDPRFTVWPYDDRVDGWDWLASASVTLTIDSDADPANGVLYTTSLSTDRWGNFNLNLRRILDVQPGQWFTISDGATTRTHVVTGLTLDQFNPATDAVTGTAVPGSDVWVNACIPSVCQNRHEVADGLGRWTADFAHPGDEPDEQNTLDLISNTWGSVHQSDADGDSTQWDIRTPSFKVWLNQNEVHGYQWTLNVPVTLTIDDPGTPQSPDYTETQLPTNDYCCGTWTGFRPGDTFEIEPGQLVVVTNGLITKTHVVVAGLTVASVDPQTDIVSGGAAAPNTQVWVAICWECRCEGRTVSAGPFADWQADFSLPGPDGQTYDIVPGTSGEASWHDEDGDGTAISWRVPNPYIEVSPGSRWAHAREWPTGAVITMTIDDPSNGAGADFTATATMGQAPWNPGDPNDIVADFDLQGFDIRSRHVITMTDGVTSKTLTVSPLAVTAMDTDADTISGIGTPGVQIQVCANLPNRCIQRWLTADGSGNWTANYAVAGVGQDDPETLNLQPGSNGWVAEYEADSDRTWADWRVPNPNLHVFVTQDRIEAREWPLGHVVTLSIDNPGTPQSPDYTTSRTIAPAPWNPDESAAEFDLSGAFHYQTGDLITVGDGVVTKTHTVMNVAVTSADPVGETISGTADPGAEVEVNIHRSGAPYRRVTAAGSGQWTADFSTPWADQGTYDITAGLNGAAMRYDADGDASRADWRVPNPRFNAWPLYDVVAGWEWPVGATVVLTIDDDGDPNNGTLYTSSVAADEWGGVKFELWSALDLQPGHRVVVSDGETTKAHTVTPLAVTSADADLDRITGTADPYAELDVEIWSWGAPSRHVTADAGGNWVANYTGAFDLVPGSNGAALRCDVDGDCTQADWRIANPYIGVLLRDKQVEGNDWPLHSTVRLTIDDPATGLSPDYTDSLSVFENPWDSNATYVAFWLSGRYDPKPGDVVTLSDGVITRTHAIPNLVVVSKDTQADVISGTTTPGAAVEVFIWTDEKILRRVTADASGNWAADFSTPGDEGDEQNTSDIAPGTQGNAWQPDAQGNGTSVNWTITWPVPSPRPFVVALGGDPNLDYNAEDFDVLVISQLMEPLYRPAPDGSLEPAGALAHTVSADGLIYTVTLRADALWSDGQPVVAQHYVDSVLRTLDPSRVSYWIDFLYPLEGAQEFHAGTITDPTQVGVTAIDSRTLQFRLKQPRGDFAAILGMPIFNPIRLDVIQQYGDGWTQPGHFVGNGPYQLVERDRAHLTIAKNPHHYDAGSVAIRTIAFSIIPDTWEQFDAYRRGDLDAIIGVGDLWAVLADPALSGDLRTPRWPGLHYLGLNTQRAPTDNLLVRRALASAIDRSAILTDVLGAPWREAATSAIPPGVPGYQNGSVGYDYDPAQAQAYLAAAGYPNGQGFPGIVLWTNYGNTPFVHAMAEQWRAVLNISVDVIQMPVAGFYGGQLGVCTDDPGRCTYNAYRRGWIMDYSDANNLLNTVFHPDSGAQHTGWDNDRYRELMALALAEMDQTARIAYYQEADRILVEDEVAIIPLHYTDRPSLVKPGVFLEFANAYYGPYFAQWGVSDIDGDGLHDLIDPCPSDATNTCDPNRSTAAIIGADGGTLATPDGSVTLDIPAGALPADTSISITDGGTGFEVTTNLGKALAVFGVDIQPEGTAFGAPITIVFRWQDANNDGVVDGTHVQERVLVISKDGRAITDRCQNDPGCDRAANTFTFQVSSLSQFALVGPFDTDGDGVPDDWSGVVDACPATPGRADRQGCPVGDLNLVELHVIDQARSGACPGSAGSCKFPIQGAEVRVFDRRDPAFQAAYGGQNPSGSIYDQVFENDIARVGACVTDLTGRCTAGEQRIGEYLVVVKYVDPDTGRAVYTGKPKGPEDFVDTDGDGAGDLATKDFQVIRLVKRDGSVQFSGGSKTVVRGSYLEIVYSDFSVWEDAAGGFVYPFIFTSDSDWMVDVCAQVPAGYQIVGAYDENGNLAPDASCLMTFVSNQTKSIAFEVVEVGSPEPQLMVQLKVRGGHANTEKALNIDVPGLRRYEDPFVTLPAEARPAQNAHPILLALLLALPLVIARLWIGARRRERRS